MTEQMNIQWYPGHMTKARRMIVENTKLIDAVCEVVDARIPSSSRNPDLDEMTNDKPRIIVLNRIDQADANMTKKWAVFFKTQGYSVIETDCKSGKGVNNLRSLALKVLEDRIKRNVQKGQPGKKLRLMIVGIPNVGKSSFINRLAGRKATLTSDRPGVTRGKQWISLGNEIELLDTPGVLWPKFEDQTVGENLAFTGAIRDAILDVQTLAGNLLLRLSINYKDRLTERYKIPADFEGSGFDYLEFAARKRGFLISGGEVDTERMAVILLDEFRAGKLGRITLEYVGNAAKQYENIQIDA